MEYIFIFPVSIFCYRAEKAKIFEKEEASSEPESPVSPFLNAIQKVCMIKLRKPGNI